MSKFISHCFSPTDTIVGAIRLYNKCAHDPATRMKLLNEFHRVNGNVLIRPGTVLQIPVWDPE